MKIEKTLNWTEEKTDGYVMCEQSWVLNNSEKIVNMKKIQVLGPSS